MSYPRGGEIASQQSGPRLGEVVATSIAEFEAQAVRLHFTPPLGTLVRARLDDGRLVYAVVAGASTEGLDTSVRPVLRGRDGREDAAIYREHPDLVFVLRSCFRCLVVGARVDNQIFRRLPDLPIPIHYSVSACPPNEADQFARRLDYFRLILAARNVPVDDVLAAHVRSIADGRDAYRATESAYAWRVRAGREISMLLRSEHQRALTLLHSIRPDGDPDLLPAISASRP